MAAVILFPVFVLRAGGSTMRLDEESGIEAFVSFLYPDETGYGNLIVRVNLKNESAVERTVTSAFRGHGHGFCPVVKRSVTLAPGSSKVVDLIYPGVDESSYFNYTIDIFPKGYAGFQLDPSVRGMYGHERNSYIFISKGIPRDSLQKGFDAIAEANKARTAHYYSSDSGCKLFRENDYSEPWRTDWRNYIPFDLWLIAESDYGALSETVKTAIRDYVAAGGRVCLYGVADIPAELKSDSRFNGVNSTFIDVQAFRFGKGSFYSYRPSDDSVVSTNAYNVVFKEKSCFVNIEVIKNNLKEANVVDGSFWADGNEVPVGLFAMLLFAFFIIAGPGALVFLAKKNMRIHIVWVLPVIGMVFGITVILSILFTEGVTPNVARAAITTLYQPEKRAVTDARVDVYSPFTLSSPLKFDAGDVVVIPDKNSVGDAGEIECGNELSYSSSFIRPRIAGTFTVRKSGPENRRIEVSREGDKIKVVNALGVRIKKLQLSDGDDHIFSGEDIEPGAVAILNRENLSGYFQILWRNNQKRRFYYAELDGCPFFENPLRDVSVKNKEAGAVIGYFDFHEDGRER